MHFWDSGCFLAIKTKLIIHKDTTRILSVKKSGFERVVSFSSRGLRSAIGHWLLAFDVSQYCF